MDKLQRLQQKNLSVEEYRQKMELYMMRASIREEETTTISRFLSGLNLEIRDRVELLPYQDLNDLVQLCIKVEQQNLRKTSSQRVGSYSNSYPKKDFKREGSTSRDESKETTKPLVKDASTPYIRARDTKCFKCFGRGHVQAQCPNQRVLFLKGKDEYTSGEDEPSTQEKGEGERINPLEGDLLMIQRILHNQPSAPIETQRENIFHTRCNVLENICSLIVDGGSCCNCCSTRLIEKLQLQVVPHPQPYNLQWINEDGELRVDKQVEIEFSIGNYKDNVLCDVVPMEACHILLGRPWQFDKKTSHNGLTNEISFIHKHKRFVLSPLPHSQVVKDQIQMKHKRDEEKIEKEKNFGKQKAWENSVPSHKVIQQVKHIENTFTNMLLVEQPSLSFCKGTLASMNTKEKSLQEACIDQEGELMGQKEVDQTLELLRGKLLSPMRKEVQRHYFKYNSCFQTTPKVKSHELYTPSPFANDPWEDTNFILKIPRTTKGFNSIFMVMDRLFSREVIHLHGLFSSIVLNRAPTFANHELRISFGKLATKLHTLNAYHPQTHGQNIFENIALSIMPRIIMKCTHNFRDEQTYHQVVHKTTSTFKVMCELNHLSSFKLLPSPIGFMPQEKVTTNDYFKIQKMIRGHTQPLKEKSCPRLPTPKDKQQWQPSKINLQTNTYALFDYFYRWTFDPGGQALKKQDAAIRDQA
ncbi:uncharacterized protein [Phaseolus vulgaris]|uniref:uncharacterized protein n=1 Tax=Phaseolus vulgaris TaxID=3885 RepID=UPI0035CBC748